MVSDHNREKGAVAMDRLAGFFRPRGIAVFGSMMEGWFFGGAVVVKELKALGYTGSVFPIHPSATTVYGLRVYQDISLVESAVDLAVIATSYRSVPGILEACGAKGVRAAVVIADNFAEAGPEGRKRQDEIVAIARMHGISVIGPNTLGIYRPHTASAPYLRKGLRPAPGGALDHHPDRHVRAPGRGMESTPSVSTASRPGQHVRHR
jgi:acyl-CoA synthetase (NDP forming)